MAILDSGNLLQQPAINASLHQSLGVEVDKTNVVARGANQLSIDIEGISKDLSQVSKPMDQFSSTSIGGTKSSFTSQLGK